MMQRSLMWAVVLLLTWTTIGTGGEASSTVPRDADAMSVRIDQLLAEYWQEKGLTPARNATDEEFLRRVYLDLTGGLPSANDVRAFLANQQPDRRARMIDSLLGTDHPTDPLPGKPDHWTHLANTWRKFVLPTEADLRRFGGGVQFQKWLREEFRKDTPYDELVRSLLLAKGNFNQNGAVLFYTVLEAKPESLAASASRAFLGVQIQCAQCHDHPFDHWKQRDFWGFAAFFAQLDRANGRARFIANVQDADIGEAVLPDTDQIIAPRVLNGEDMFDTSDGVTRREKLAKWLTAPENPYFARTTVNRVWSMLFGRGIVEPVDDFGDHNAASHPQLLRELSEYFVASGFDMRELIRAIANTEAYQLASSYAGETAPPPESFAKMALKSLTAEQLYESLGDATVLRDSRPRMYTAAVDAAVDFSRFAFINKFRNPGGASEYHAGIPQALTLMNGTMIDAATSLKRSDLLVSLSAPFFSDEQRVETLFLAVLSRYPTAGEQSQFVEYVVSRESSSAKQEALSDILWALLNSAEFTLNH